MLPYSEPIHPVYVSQLMDNTFSLFCSYFHHFPYMYKWQRRLNLSIWLTQLIKARHIWLPYFDDILPLFFFWLPPTSPPSKGQINFIRVQDFSRFSGSNCEISNKSSPTYLSGRLSIYYCAQYSGCRVKIIFHQVKSVIGSEGRRLL